MSVQWCNFGALFCSHPKLDNRNDEHLGVMRPTSARIDPQLDYLSAFFQCNSLGPVTYSMTSSTHQPHLTQPHRLGSRIVVARPGLVVIRNGSDVHIDAVSTNKENTMLFYPNVQVLPPTGQKKIKFSSNTLCLHSPLVRQLMKLRGISQVTLTPDCVKVKICISTVSWSTLKPHILDALIEFFSTDLQVVTSSSPQRKHYHNKMGECVCDHLKSENDVVLEDRINRRLRPAVQEEGGDVVFKEFNEKSGKAFVYLHGTCLRNQGATKAIKNAILCMLQFHVTEVKTIVGIAVPAPDRKKSSRS